MTEGTRIQNPSESNMDMFPSESRGESSSIQNHVQTSRALDPRNSLDDYNRLMLEYTHRQMSSFVDQDDGNSSGGSSRSSQSSVHSGTSNSGRLVSVTNSPPPTSASAARHATEKANRKLSQNPS
ncbi:uncharacterized protein PFLUO_LOCUS5537 [Penicillium psychrofluorescens]|uniref:uncharacterized protein n=1 Tax=Penicillium psychrofluorescens TaxID=3158075 RepID=UPI003CCDB8A7